MSSSVQPLPLREIYHHLAREQFLANPQYDSPEFPRALWREEVAQEKTQRGYWGWLSERYDLKGPHIYACPICRKPLGELEEQGILGYADGNYRCLKDEKPLEHLLSSDIQDSGVARI